MDLVAKVLTGYAVVAFVGSAAYAFGSIVNRRPRCEAPAPTPPVAPQPSAARVKVSPIPFWLVVPDLEHSYLVVTPDGHSHLALTTQGHRALAGHERKN